MKELLTEYAGIIERYEAMERLKNEAENAIAKQLSELKLPESGAIVSGGKSFVYSYSAHHFDEEEEIEVYLDHIEVTNVVDI